MVVHTVTTELLRVKAYTQNWKYGFFAHNIIMDLSISEYTIVKILRKVKHPNILIGLHSHNLTG
jgi:hypothetical protein